MSREKGRDIHIVAPPGEESRAGLCVTACQDVPFFRKAVLIPRRDRKPRTRSSQSTLIVMPRVWKESYPPGSEDATRGFSPATPKGFQTG
jgi:hypothetical protein